MRISINSILASFLVTLGLVAATAQDASAITTGWVQGRLQYYEAEGGYCPSSRNCTGAKYLQSQYGTQRDLQYIKVVIKKPSGTILAQGYTDATGFFKLQWASSTPNPSASLRWSAEHRDNRFSMEDLNGSRITGLVSAGLTLAGGTTSTFPQDLGTFGVGTAALPNPFLNVWGGATMVWNQSLASSNRFVSNYTGLRLVAFTTAANDCPTSCAFLAGNVVRLDQNGAYSPQARVMHEMGHIASYKAFIHDGLVNYCWPTMDCSTGTGGWNYQTSEWLADSFEEAIATFFSDVAFYSNIAPEPYSCYASQGNVCTTGYTSTSSNIEASTGPASVCGAGTNPEFRRPMTSLRYLRDVYDDSWDYDVNSGLTDVVAVSYATIVDRLAAYPVCFGDHCTQEPFADTMGNPIDDADGRSVYDLQFHLAAAGIQTSTQLSMNCF